jgi:hypothetical protein
MRNMDIAMINKQEMDWAIEMLFQLENGNIDRPLWHYAECRKIVERMKLIIEKDEVGQK